MNLRYDQACSQSKTGGTFSGDSFTWKDFFGDRKSFCGRMDHCVLTDTYDFENYNV